MRLVCLVACADAVSLPSVPASQGVPEGAWSVLLGERKFHAPMETASLAVLSPDVSKYYAAQGVASGLTEEAKQYLVGSEGNWHIFHLPEGASMLQLPRNGDRRASFSSLVQLSDDMKLATTFPAYELSATDTDSRSSEVQAVERQAGSLLTEEMYRGYLEKVVGVGESDTKTRSHSDATATEAAISLLKREFEGMGYTVCEHSVGEHTNVVAFKAGSGKGQTMTVGAHYDSRPFTGAAPGAEDNGSGVASLLSVAKALAESKVKTNKNLYFVGFADEEEGMKGSAAFVEALSSNSLPEACKGASGGSFLQTRSEKKLFKANDHMAIVLDEVGWKSPNLDKPTVNLESYDWTREVMSNLALSSQMHNGDKLNVVHSNNPFGSDHMSFLDKKIKGVLVINGDDTKYPNYHQSTDTIENVDMPYALAVTKMVFGGVMRSAGVEM